MADNFGTINLKKLLKYSIALASKGFPVGKLLSKAIKLYNKELTSYSWSKLFSGLKMGDFLINSELSLALSTIA